MDYFDTKPVGEVLSRVTNDVDTSRTEFEPKRDAAYYFCDDSDRSSRYDACRSAPLDDG